MTSAHAETSRVLRGVSLFSGCGGSDLGAKRAGVEMLMANDISKTAAATYQSNAALLANDAIDFRAVDVATIQSLPECDVLFGCYPCQSFTMGGPRTPAGDPRTSLYREFARLLSATKPRFFVAENVPGLQWLQGGRYLADQLDALASAGSGYHVSVKLLDAKDYGAPADRRRLFLVGVRQDIGLFYWFADSTHGPAGSGLATYESHGRAIEGLPLDPQGDYYSLVKPEDSWWYMSRNRKRAWSAPSATIVANAKHIPLHPASQTLHLASSDIQNKSRQTWKFSGTWEHIAGHPERPILTRARRLSWRECAVLQTFPSTFEPEGGLSAKYAQIGNAVPPLLMEAIVRPITEESGLRVAPPPYLFSNSMIEPLTAEPRRPFLVIP